MVKKDSPKTNPMKNIVLDSVHVTRPGTVPFLGGYQCESTSLSVLGSTNVVPIAMVMRCSVYVFYVCYFFVLSTIVLLVMQKINIILRG